MDAKALQAELDAHVEWLHGHGGKRADLSWADLRGADLSQANLSRAGLRWTTLATQQTPWEWATVHRYPMRTVDGRILCGAPRTRVSRWVGAQEYEPGRTYRAAWFSTDATTDCHPGLYVGQDGNHEDTVWVAFWLDEALVAGGKCRCKRFRVLQDRDGFADVTTAQMDEEPVVVTGLPQHTEAR